MTTLESSLPRRRSPVLALLALVPFTVFSLWVVATRGYTGFLALAGRDAWALQMLLDLSLALIIGVRWMRADAHRRGLAIWPYVIATVLVGSIGLLAYYVRSCFATPRQGT